jgi:methylmalonyl-CoA/ethylmalonyl-CoA epimerase
MTPIRRLDHVAIAVRDTDAALGYFRDVLGLAVVHSEVNEPAGARLTYLDAGNCWLQLVEPLRGDAPIAEHLREHGEGLHHLCFAVDDVERDVRALSDGVAPPLGSGRGRTSAFVPGAPQFGTRVECTTYAPEDDAVRPLGRRRSL